LDSTGVRSLFEEQLSDQEPGQHKEKVHAQSTTWKFVSSAVSSDYYQYRDASEAI